MEIQNALRAYNPWWLGAKLAAKKFRRNAFYLAHRALGKSSFQRAVLLSGPRRVGKTTILLQLAEALLAAGVPSAQVMYVSLDHPMLRNVTVETLLKAHAEAAETDPGQKIFLLLDEMHYAQDWPSWLKWLVDFHPRVRIIATGSASFAVQMQSKESAAGRFVTIRVPPLLFSEYLALREAEPPNLPAAPALDDLFGMSAAERRKFSAQCESLQAHLQRYLLVGGFPETAAISEIETAHRLLREDVLEAVLKRDLVAFFSLRTVTEVESLFLYLCLKSGGIQSVQELGSALELNKATINNLLAVLEQAALIFRLAPLDISGKKLLKARYKYYAADASLRCAMLLRSSAIFADARETGVVTETAAVAHIMAALQPRAQSFGYWRDAKTQKEVDVVLQLAQEFLPVEIKYRDDAALAKDSGLITFAQNESVQRAVLVTKAAKDFSVEPLPSATPTALLKIPLYLLLFVLGKMEAH